MRDYLNTDWHSFRLLDGTFQKLSPTIINSIFIRLLIFLNSSHWNYTGGITQTVPQESIVKHNSHILCVLGVKGACWEGGGNNGTYSPFLPSFGKLLSKVVPINQHLIKFIVVHSFCVSHCFNGPSHAEAF